MAEVKLFVKHVSYVDKNGNDKVASNFFIKAGNSSLIPIEVKYFPDADNNNIDRNYNSRKDVVSAFAEILENKTTPKAEKPSNVKPEDNKQASSSVANPNNSDLPF